MREIYSRNKHRMSVAATKWPGAVNRYRKPSWGSGEKTTTVSCKTTSDVTVRGKDQTERDCEKTDSVTQSHDPENLLLALEFGYWKHKRHKSNWFWSGMMSDCTDLPKNVKCGPNMYLLCAKISSYPSKNFSQCDLRAVSGPLALHSAIASTFWETQYTMISLRLYPKIHIPIRPRDLKSRPQNRSCKKGYWSLIGGLYFEAKYTISPNLALIMVIRLIGCVLKPFKSHKQAAYGDLYSPLLAIQCFHVWKATQYAQNSKISSTHIRWKWRYSYHTTESPCPRTKF